MAKFNCVGVDKEYPKRYLDFHKAYLVDNTLVSKYLRMLRDDIVLFIEMCCLCSSKGKGNRNSKLIPNHFELFEKQKEIARDFERIYQGDTDYAGAVISKSRQLGCSWLFAACALWVATFYKDQSIMITSKDESGLHTKNDTNTFLGKIDYMISNFPKILTNNITTSSRTNYIKVNSSNIEGKSGDKGIRGSTPALMIHDEFAFNDFDSSIMEQAVSCNCPLFFLSTLNTPDKEFDKLRSNPVYHQIVMTVEHDDPRITNYQEFRERKIAELNYDVGRYEKEYELKYDTSNEARIFTPKHLEYLKVHRLESEEYRSYPIFAGLDIAGGGSNKTVLTIKQGYRIIYRKKWNEPLGYKIVDSVIKDCIEWRVLMLCFDEIGIGSAIVSEFDRLANSGFNFGFKIQGVNVGLPAPGFNQLRGMENKVFYSNIRSMLHDTLSDAVVKSIEYDNNSIKDNTFIDLYKQDDILSEMAYAMKTGNDKKYQVMSKKELKSRGFQSPDSLDSLLLAYACEIYYYVSAIRKHLWG